MLKTTTALAAVSALLAAPAFAGNVSEPAPEPVIDTPAPVPAAPASPNWTGFYGGGQLGFGSVDTSVSGADEDIIGGFTGGVAGPVQLFGMPRTYGVSFSYLFN